MNRKLTIKLVITIALFLLFSLFTYLVLTVDVKNIGADGTAVGFSTINNAVFTSTGYDLKWYKITEATGYLCLAVLAAIAVYGVYQLIKNKSLFKVDKEIIALAFMAVAFVICYVIFELLVVNYRPIKLDGELAASYPSTHTTLAVIIMTSAIIYLNKKIDKKYEFIKIIAIVAFSVVALITVVGRSICGVHWLTDIIGGLILSAALIALYLTLIDLVEFFLEKINKKKLAPEASETIQDSAEITSTDSDNN